MRYVNCIYSAAYKRHQKAKNDAHTQLCWLPVVIYFSSFYLIYLPEVFPCALSCQTHFNDRMFTAPVL